MKQVKIIIRILLLIAEIGLILMFFLPMFAGIKNIGAIFGLCLSLLFFGITAFWTGFKRLIKKLLAHKIGKIAVISIGGIFALLTAYAITLSALMLNAALSSPKAPQAVIVLGCKVQPSGSPSLMLSKRIQAAYEYLTKNPDVICVTSGGKGGDEPLSEGGVMKSELVKMGIAEDRIFAEEKSESTRQNIEFSLALLKEHNIEVTEAAIVTDGFHQFRAKLIASEFDIKPTAVSAHTPSWLVSAYWIREWFALSHRFVFNS